MREDSFDFIIFGKGRIEKRLGQMNIRQQDETLMGAAIEQAAKALENGEFPVGCVIADGSRILAGGGRQSSRGGTANEIDHAEILALKALYETFPDMDGSHLSLYATLEPCLMCFGAILIAGIGRVVYAYEDVMGGGTGCGRRDLPPLYRNRSVTVVPHVCREQSLELMQRFFSDPDNPYLQGTLLAEYTLKQN